MALAPSLSGKHGDLPYYGISSCDDLKEHERQSTQLYCIYFYSAHVDEFFAAYPCMADTIGEKWGIKYHPLFSAPSQTEYNQYTLCNNFRYGI